MVVATTYNSAIFVWEVTSDAIPMDYNIVNVVRYFTDAQGAPKQSWA